MSLYDLQQLLASVFPVLVPAAGAIYTFIATRQAAARKETDTILKRLTAAEQKIADANTHAHTLVSVVDRLAAFDTRINAIEGELKHLPNRDDLHELKIVIVELSGTVGRLEEKLVGIDRRVTNLDSYMRSGGGNG